MSCVDKESMKAVYDEIRDDANNTMWFDIRYTFSSLKKNSFYVYFIIYILVNNNLFLLFIFYNWN